MTDTHDTSVLLHRGHTVVDAAWMDLIEGELRPRRDWFVLEHANASCPFPSEPHASPVGARAEIDRCLLLKDTQPDGGTYATPGFPHGILSVLDESTPESRAAAQQLEMERSS